MSRESFMDKMRKAGKSMVDVGAKTMLKTDVVFLERQIKSRKQEFGVQVYELMEQLEVDTATPTDQKEAKIRAAFDNARKDIAVIQAKIECKKEEVGVLDAESGNTSSNIPPSSGVVLNDGQPAANSVNE